MSELVTAEEAAKWGAEPQSREEYMEGESRWKARTLDLLHTRSVLIEALEGMLAMHVGLCETGCPGLAAKQLLSTIHATEGKNDGRKRVDELTEERDELQARADFLDNMYLEVRSREERESDLQSTVDKLREERHEGFWPSMMLENERLQSTVDTLRVENGVLTNALRVVQSRRDLINATLGYEFVGEYIDPALSTTKDRSEPE